MIGGPDEEERSRWAVEAGAASRRRRRLNASIWFKLSMVVGLLVVVSSGTVGLVTSVYSTHFLQREIMRRLTSLATLRSDQLDAHLSAEKEKLDLFANRVLILDYLGGVGVSAETAKSDLESAVSAIADVASAAVYNRTGFLSLATAGNVFSPQLSAQQLSSFVGGEVQFSLPVQEGTGWRYYLSRAMLRDGERVGVLVGWMNATRLQEVVQDRTGLQRTGEVLVGLPLNSSSVRLLLPPVLEPDRVVISLSVAMERALRNESGFVEQEDFDGTTVVVAYTPLRFRNWGLLTKMRKHEAYAPLKSLKISIVITVIATLAFGIACSFLLARVFVFPILELSRVAAALGRGDMTARLKDDTVWLRDEIDDLSQVFNSMADQISSHQSTLELKVLERTRDLARSNDSLKVEIKERMRMEVELEKAKDTAVAANSSKSQFLANMSHEIRTPLNGIINCTELCLDTPISPEQEEYLNLVRFSAKHLLRIITDILDFSKIEAGKLEMEEIQFSLYDQLEHAVSVLAARAHRKGLELACGVRGDVPDQIIGDPGRLFQVFVNLIGNSIKFTSEGEVIVSACLLGTGADFVELQFSVEDTGIGIPKHKQSCLFQAFSQADTSTSRLYGGTGLGLVISSKLAAAMGGRMWVESEGKGSTFSFTAVFHIPPACELPSPLTVAGMKHVPVLVVDDNDSSRRILVEQLQNWGMLAVGANSIETAKVALRSAVDAGKQFKVLVLDMWLQQPTDATDLVHFVNENPHLLGSCRKVNDPPVTQPDQELDAQASAELDDVDPELPVSLTPGATTTTTTTSASSEGHWDHQQQLGTGQVERRKPDKALSIVMLTSVANSDATKCRQLGIQVHTSKPIKRVLLVRALHAALGVWNHQEGGSSVNQGRTTQDVKSKGLHILVAEDNIVNQRVAMTLLQKWGHTTVLACNGQEAVEKAAGEEFDLILMDVQMPVMDGFQATSKIRENDHTRGVRSRIPIVAMTAHAMTGDGETCIAAGMDDYVSKPLNANKLQELLQQVASGSLQQRT